MRAAPVAPASEQDLYWEWVRAEVDVPAGSPRAPDRQQHGLDARLLSILADGSPGLLSPADRQALRAAYRRLRGDYLEPLLGSGTTWVYAEISADGLADVLIPNLSVSFVPLAPSRRLEEFVGALDRGRPTPGLPNLAVYLQLRREFEPGRMRGCPILVAEREDGPYVLAEGLTRACVVVSRHLRGESAPVSLRVLLGVSPRVREWRWW